MDTNRATLSRRDRLMSAAIARPEPPSHKGAALIEHRCAKLFDIIRESGLAFPE
jgi:hypothetical protein